MLHGNFREFLLKAIENGVKAVRIPRPGKRKNLYVLQDLRTLLKKSSGLAKLVNQQNGIHIQNELGNRSRRLQARKFYFAVSIGLQEEQGCQRKRFFRPILRERHHKL